METQVELLEYFRNLRVELQDVRVNNEKLRKEQEEKGEINEILLHNLTKSKKSRSTKNDLGHS